MFLDFRGQMQCPQVSVPSSTEVCAAMGEKSACHAAARPRVGFFLSPPANPSEYEEMSTRPQSQLLLSLDVLEIPLFTGITLCPMVVQNLDCVYSAGSRFCLIYRPRNQQYTHPCLEVGLPLITWPSLMVRRSFLDFETFQQS